MATVLLFGATLMFQTFVAIQGVDLGFAPENVFTASVSTPRETSRESSNQEGQFNQQFILVRKRCAAVWAELKCIS